MAIDGTPRCSKISLAPSLLFRSFVVRCFITITAEKGGPRNRTSRPRREMTAMRLILNNSISSNKRREEIYLNGSSGTAFLPRAKDIRVSLAAEEGKGMLLRQLLRTAHRLTYSK